MADYPIPEKYKLPSKIKRQLPDSEKESAAQELWNKSKGLCFLCERPLDRDGKGIQIDHDIPESLDGPTTLTNLNLTHGTCNRIKNNLEDTGLTRALLKFRFWIEVQDEKTFQNVIKQYLGKKGEKRIKYAIPKNKKSITVEFDSKKEQYKLYEDPAWCLSYFFAEIPKEFFLDDPDSQPRTIQHDHVWKLAVDFMENPVHEPSNCRLVPVKGSNLAELRQFDGQHKTTAQIVIGRDMIPTKVYIDPEIAKLDQLVIQIQQGIKKRPLYQSETLSKMSDVIRAAVNEYKDKNDGAVPTEQELVNAQPGSKQKQFRKAYLGELVRLVYDDPDLRLDDFASAKSSPTSPFTEKIVLNRIIQPLICQKLLDEPLDNSVERETERRQIVEVLNAISDNMLQSWEMDMVSGEESPAHKRAKTFFLGGTVNWWMKCLLVPVIQVKLNATEWDKMFLKEFPTHSKELLLSEINVLCGWALWSTDDQDVLAAFRSNTIDNVNDKVDTNKYGSNTLTASAREAMAQSE